MAPQSDGNAMPGGGSPTQGEDLAAEIARVRAERDELAALLDARAHRRTRRRTRRRGARRWVALVLVVLAAVLIPLTTIITWVHESVLDTDTWVATVAPIGSDPAVTDALARQLSAQITAAVDAEEKIAAALPDTANLLAAPLAGQVNSFIGDEVHKVLESPAFEQAWIAANRFAHAQIVAVLEGEGEGDAIQPQGNEVVLNLVPVLNKALQQIQLRASDLLGKQVQLPTISGDELPAAACEKISEVLDRPVPQTCGQIPLFPADALDSAKAVVQAFDRITILLLVLTPLTIIAALALSVARRRAALQIVVASMFGLVVVRRSTMYVEGRLTDAAKPENRAAASAIVGEVLDGLFTVTWALLAAGLVIFLLLLVTGPYRWARALRRAVRRGTSAVVTTTANLARNIGDGVREDGTRRWIRDHKGALEIGGVAVAVLLLLLIDMNPLTLLIIAILLGGYEFLIVRLVGEPASAARTEPPPAP